MEDPDHAGPALPRFPPPGHCFWALPERPPPRDIGAMRKSTASSLIVGLLAALIVAPAFAQTAQRGVEPVIVKGSKVVGWSGPSAQIVCNPYPSGGLTGDRDAHGGTFVTPPATGIPV